MCALSAWSALGYSSCSPMHFRRIYLRTRLKGFLLDKQAAVSIGMPVYNMAGHVGEAIESLLAQTHTDYELIISDNASTDATLEIVKSFELLDERIRVLEQRSNLGAIANFEAALDAASGDWFMWAASDDVWSHDWLEAMVKSVVGYDRAAFGVVEVTSSDGETIPHPANQRRFRFEGCRTWRQLKYFMEPPVLGKANLIYGLYPTWLLRSSRFTDFGQVPFAADIAYVYHLLSQVEIVSVPGPVLKKRHLETSEGELLRDIPVTAFQRLTSPVRNIFKSTIFFRVMKKSTLIERLLIPCVLPVHLFRSVLAGFHSKRVSRGSRRRG